jgi:hypothetical protein
MGKKRCVADEAAASLRSMDALRAQGRAVAEDMRQPRVTHVPSRMNC